MELSIDTAADMAGLALSHEGVPIAELVWRCQRNHSTEVMPAIERLFQQSQASKDDLTAVFVNIGPGSYTGLRVGISLAKALAFARRLPLVGVGRLEMDAYQALRCAATSGPACAVHRAGRAEVAWAAYKLVDGELHEIAPPQLCRREDLPAVAPLGSLFWGEIDDALAAIIGEQLGPEMRIVTGVAAIRRPGFLAELGWQRLQASCTDDPAALRPLYLREPAIGPPTQS